MEPADSISLLGEILAFAGFLFAAFKYSQEKKREFQKRFFEEQLKVYNEAVDCASIISIYNKESDEYKKATMDFRRLFWGKMCVIEDKEVEARMAQFNEALRLYENQLSSESQTAIKNLLRDLTLALAHACRNSSIKTWEMEYKMERFNDYTSQLDNNRERIDAIRSNR